MIHSIRYGVTHDEARDFFMRLPMFARACAVHDDNPETAADRFAIRASSAAVSAMSGCTLAWADTLHPTSPLCNIHIATAAGREELLAAARPFIDRLHQTFPHILCAIPVCFRGAIACADALGFRKLCVVPGATFLWRRQKFVAMRLAIHERDEHGQEA